MDHKIGKLISLIKMTKNNKDNLAVTWGFLTGLLLMGYGFPDMCIYPNPPHSLHRINRRVHVLLWSEDTHVLFSLIHLPSTNFKSHSNLTIHFLVSLTACIHKTHHHKWFNKSTDYFHLFKNILLLDTFQQDNIIHRKDGKTVSK